MPFLPQAPPNSGQKSRNNRMRPLCNENSTGWPPAPGLAKQKALRMQVLLDRTTAKAYAGSPSQNPIGSRLSLIPALQNSILSRKRSYRLRGLSLTIRWEMRGAEGIVLGCTEFPLIIKPADVAIPVTVVPDLSVIGKLPRAKTS